MKDDQIIKLKENCDLPDSCNNIESRETHISWVILTDNYAFKIKKPVKYDFLDFSTLEKRKQYCLRELKLNLRLEPEMYLKVVPVTQRMIDPGKNGKEVIDYAVQMNRMDDSLEMGRLLKEEKVQEEDINRLSRKTANFHKNTKVIKSTFNTTGFQDNYAELLDEKDFVAENIGKDSAGKIRECVERSHIFLNNNRDLFNERITRGFQKDGHGDLNSHNILLYDEPVIFDCIEYNDEFRQIDVLNDVAFLCVDLDFYDKSDLGEQFYRQYLENMGYEEGEEERRLINYYKSFRANIRAKVTIFREKNRGKDEMNKEVKQDIKKYIDLMSGYMNRIDE